MGRGLMALLMGGGEAEIGAPFKEICFIC